MPDEITLDNLPEIVAKEPDQLLPEEKTFLDNNKGELTSDELTKFGYETAQPKPPTPPADPGKSGEEEELDPDDEKVVGKIVEKQVSPALKRLEEMETRTAIDSFIISNPSFAKYKNSITEFKKHPDYKNVPVDQIAKMVASDDLMKIGARKEREAAAAARATQNHSNSARPAGTQKDWGSASAEEFAAKKAEVLGHR